MRMLVAISAALAAIGAAPAAANDAASMARLAAAAAHVPPPLLTERFGPDDLRSGTLRIQRARGRFPSRC